MTISAEAEQELFELLEDLVKCNDSATRLRGGCFLCNRHYDKIKRIVDQNRGFTEKAGL